MPLCDPRPHTLNPKPWTLKLVRRCLLLCSCSSSPAVTVHKLFWSGQSRAMRTVGCHTSAPPAACKAGCHNVWAMAPLAVPPCMTPQKTRISLPALAHRDCSTPASVQNQPGALGPSPTAAPR